MNGLDRVLDRWTCTAVRRDWDDVLRRSAVRHAERRVPWRPAAALGAALLVLAAAPALGVADEVRALLGDDRPTLRLRATLRGPGGATGRLELDARGAFLRSPGRKVVVPIVRPRGDGKFHPNARYTFRWAIDVVESETVAARILHGRRALATICDPCGSRSSGTLRVSRPRALAIFNGRTTAVVRTRQATLRGPILLARRR